MYTLHSKFTPIFFVLLSFFLFFRSLSLFLLSFMFFLNKKIQNSRLIIGGAKNGVSPILIIGGRVPRLPPRVYAYASIYDVHKKIRYLASASLWPHETDPFPLRTFTLNRPMPYSAYTSLLKQLIHLL